MASQPQKASSIVLGFFLCGCPSMEMSSSHRCTRSARMRTSLSVGSLDLGLLVNTPFVHSLMSESITFCSLSSISSKLSDAPPVFRLRRLPTFQMIELGDQLKMFSSAGITQPKDEYGRTLDEKNVLISTPTFPRLKSMLKECLSISKWVETSAGWQPPGHIPWESVQDTAGTCWVPEGAIFSPDYFSVALSQSRRSCCDARMDTKSCLHSPCPMSSDEFMNTGSPAPRSLTGQTMDAELLDMMQELKCIRTFFQDSPDICEPKNLSLPSLIVSNPHFMFPMPLESSCSISQPSLNSLAFRRGKKTPPTLLLRKSTSVQEIFYPGIPTAFLGSPSQYCPKVEHLNAQEKPGLEFEEMINNLRLQCSTMSLQTPPIDASWNSRSTSGSIDTRLKEANSDEWSFADGFLEDQKHLPLSYLTTGSRTSHTHHRAPTFAQSALHGQRSSPQTILIPERKNMAKATKASTYASSTTTSSGSDMSQTEPLPLRSAMTKPIVSARLKPSKSVRFFLTHQELQKELDSAAPYKENTPTEEESAAKPVSPAKQQYKRVLSTAVFPRDGLQRSASHEFTPSSRLRGRARSATASSPLRQSIVAKAMGTSESTKSISTDTRSRILMQSLGRHSLSRIIKGPIFPARDKRATISSISVMTNDENSARRESVGHAFIHKKSRMPVPLRNILTRFK